MFYAQSVQYSDLSGDLTRCSNSRLCLSAQRSQGIIGIAPMSSTKLANRPTAAAASEGSDYSTLFTFVCCVLLKKIVYIEWCVSDGGLRFARRAQHATQAGAWANADLKNQASRPWCAKITACSGVVLLLSNLAKAECSQHIVTPLNV